MEWTPNDLILTIGAGSAAIAGLIAAIQKSRCSTIDCCCFKCKRDLTPIKQDKEEKQIEAIT